MRILLLNILIFLFVFPTYGQSLCDSLPFINCNENVISIRNNKDIQDLILKFQNLNNKEENIQIVHIGDSHLQAAFLTERIKQNLFEYFQNQTKIAAPGFIYPFTIAQTNNPFFYKVSYTGNWEWCKNVDQEKTCELGLSGITVKTNDSISSFTIKMQNEKYQFPNKYFFNRIKIFHNIDSSIKITINNYPICSNNDYSFVQLDKLTDSVSVNISIEDSGNFFELYGIILENDESKINYHTIGVNGATAQSYLKCDYFSDQLELINPDLIIISLGTNEAYDKEFLPLEHKFILSDLILQIKNTVPTASILLTSPNDHLKDMVSNKQNIEDVRKNIFEICDEFHLSSWDFYSIMGGAESINLWNNNGLTGADRLHFKKIGYEIQGDLFTKAFLNLVEKKKSIE